MGYQLKWINEDSDPNVKITLQIIKEDNDEAFHISKKMLYNFPKEPTDKQLTWVDILYNKLDHKIAIT